MSKNDSLFQILNAIDKSDVDSYDDFEKEYNPYMVMKWLASCKDPQRVTRVNELLNVVTFGLHNQKRLLYYLSCALSDGEKKRYQWITRAKNKKSTEISLMSQYFDITPREARTSLCLYGSEDFIEMAEELGYTEAELKKLSKKLKNAT